MLDYEKLDVCRIALKFVVTTVEIRDRLPRGNGELQDQFKRALFSIVLNIAEGTGKLKQAGKRHYFSIARGSVMECGALFDLFNALGNLSQDEYRAGKLLRTRIGAMLCTLCLLGRVTPLFRVRSRLRARACSRPETPILPTRFHEEPFFQK